MKDETRKRHIAKAFTWRIVGTLDTMILAWIISGNPLTGVQIGGFDFFTKIILYYLHERVWYKANLPKEMFKGSNRKRHLAKTISWRLVGTTETILISWIITGNPLSGLKIGLLEVITKMGLYYLHERVWFKFDYGLTEREKKQ